MSRRKQKGIVLISIFFVLVIFLILVASFVIRGVQERDITQRQKESFEAFNLAEAGLDRAVVELRNNFNWTGVSNVSLGRGEYSVVVQSVSSSECKVDCFGYIPSVASPRITQHIEAYIREYIPSNFYDNAVYCAGEVEVKDSNSLIQGDVRYTDSIENNGTINGAIIQDPSISPLARLDFNQLYNISLSQGNVYSQARLEDVQSGLDSFPASFWYDQPTAMPNVVYVETDLEVKGDIGTIGGFFVVVGDVLTNPGAQTETELKGYGQVEGCIYTLGEFEIEGDAAGGGLNVNGGVWSADETELKDDATVQYNTSYMQAVGNLGLNPEAQIVSWRQI